ncbi:MAG: 30S ribosomal protein S18 [bacterium]
MGRSPGGRRDGKRGGGGRGGGGGGRPYGPRRTRRVCEFCVEKKLKIDYKNVQLMEKYITDRGKIKPRRMTGACARHQRKITTAVKRAREIALVPYSRD